MRLPRPLRVLTACAALLAPSLALAAPPAPEVQIASSAMLVLDARVQPHDIVLHIARNADHAPVAGAGNVSAEIDGHPRPITPDGTAYMLSTHGLKGGRHTLQLVVAHDGIHELLTGTLTLPKRPDRLATLEQHGYGAWWVLNIVVLLLAARLIMRRKKPPAKPS